MPATVLTEYIYVFARIAMADTQLFAHLIAVSAPVIRKSETDLWDALMDQWWRKVGTVLVKLKPSILFSFFFFIANLISSV
jgi:hypothetical protein